MKGIIKISSSLAMLVLAVCMSMCVVSCGDDDENELVPQQKKEGVPQNKEGEEGQGLEPIEKAIVGMWTHTESGSGEDAIVTMWWFKDDGEGYIINDGEITASFHWTIVSENTMHLKMRYYAGDHASREEYDCNYSLRGNTLFLEETEYHRNGL